MLIFDFIYYRAALTDGTGALSQAGVNFDFPQAGFAVHRAAPMEFAHAPLGPALPVGFVAAVAAQQVAAVDRFRCLQTIESIIFNESFKSLVFPCLILNLAPSCIES